MDRELYEVEKDILEQQPPNIWSIWTEGNLERAIEVDFQKFAVAVQERVNINIDKITTFAFYATVEYIKEKNKTNN